MKRNTRAQEILLGIVDIMPTMTVKEISKKYKVTVSAVYEFCLKTGTKYKASKYFISEREPLEDNNELWDVDARENWLI